MFLDTAPDSHSQYGTRIQDSQIMRIYANSNPPKTLEKVTTGTINRQKGINDSIPAPVKRRFRFGD
jgi:hypothetical protein